jgi:hypothetical protein
MLVGHIGQDDGVRAGVFAMVTHFEIAEQRVIGTCTDGAFSPSRSCVRRSMAWSIAS